MLYGVIECSIHCPKCDQPLPLNGPLETAHCEHCQAAVDIPHDFWFDILGELFDGLRKGWAEGEGSESTIFGTFNTTLLTARFQPYCYECKTNFEVDESRTERYNHTCVKCGKVIEVRPGPEWLEEKFRQGTVLVNADSNEGAAEEAGATSEPIAFMCPQCGGALMVDGSDRVLRCQFCGVQVYLPDDLWRRLHPVKTKERWWIGFRLPGKRKGSEDEPDLVLFDGKSPYPLVWPNPGLQASGTRGANSGTIPRLKTGWRVQVGTTGYRNNPALVKGRVYVTTGKAEEGDHKPEGLWCLDAETGAVIWHHPTPESSCISGVVVAYDRCYFNCEDGKLHCVSAETGEKVWELDYEYDNETTPVVYRGRVYVAGGDSKLYCLNASDGAVLWSVEYEPNYYFAPLVVDDRVIIQSEDQYLLCADADTGVVVWKDEFEYELSSGPIAAEGKIFYANGDGRVYCRDPKDGKVLWVSEEMEGFESSPCFAFGRLLIGARDDHLHCLDADTGAELWKFFVDWDVDSSPCAADGRVYFGDDDDTVYALDLENGHKKDSFKAGGKVNSPLIVVNGRVYFHCSDGYFYCLK